MIHFFDINIILGNLLENAIEAAKKTEEKTVNVNIQFKSEMLRIEIENSYSKELLKEGTGKLNFATTKRIKEQHGIGLHSVNQIVEKYKGLMEIDTQEKCFCVKILLYMTEKV